MKSRTMDNKQSKIIRNYLNSWLLKHPNLRKYTGNPGKPAFESLLNALLTYNVKFIQINFL